MKGWQSQKFHWALPLPVDHCLALVLIMKKHIVPSLSRSLSLSLTHTHTLSLSLSLSVSRRYSRTHQQPSPISMSLSLWHGHCTSQSYSVWVCERERVRVWELNEAFGDINERKERKQRIESWIPLRGGLNCRKKQSRFWNKQTALP